MASFLGSGRQWELFGRGLKRLQRRDGFKILHATHFKGLTGEFKGWSGPKCLRLANEMMDLFRTELAEGIVTNLPFDLYQSEFVEKLPRKMHKTSQYGVCFLATLERLLAGAGEAQRRGKFALSIVLEDGHRNAEDAHRVFKDRRERYRKKLGAQALETFTLASKEDSPELMAADFLAHTFSSIGHEHPGGIQGFGETTTQKPKAGESGVTVQMVTAEYLQQLRNEFEEDRRAKEEDYLKRRAAWEASQKKKDES